MWSYTWPHWLTFMWFLSFINWRWTERYVCVHLVYDAFNIQPNVEAQFNSAILYFVIKYISLQIWFHFYRFTFEKKVMNERKKITWPTNCHDNLQFYALFLCSNGNIFDFMSNKTWKKDNPIKMYECINHTRSPRSKVMT